MSMIKCPECETEDSSFAHELACNAVKVREEFSVEKIGLEWLE